MSNEKEIFGFEPEIEFNWKTGKHISLIKLEEPQKFDVPASKQYVDEIFKELNSKENIEESKRATYERMEFSRIWRSKNTSN
jgi:hypothetical protein